VSNREDAATRLERQIAFLVELEKLKQVLRRTHPVGADRRENSAEHSWHVAMAAMVLAEYANEPVDVAHVVRMALVHDIIEIDAGDTFAYDPVGYLDKAARERAAAERIFALLPSPHAAELRALWDEFEAGETAAARFANAMDRLLPVLQNYRNHGGTWVEANLDRDRVDARLGPIANGSTVLWDYVCTILDDAMAQGMIRVSE
jgi:putative hydrolase of HD superfamily